MEQPFFIPVPCVCQGIIQKYLSEEDLYEVLIYDSPMGDFQGEIFCKLIYSPGNETNFFDGDVVKALVTFQFGGVEMTYQGVDPTTSNYILGLCNENSLTSVRVKHPVSGNEKDYTFVHPKTGAGLVANDQGSATIATGGSIRSIWKPFGHGSMENSHKTEAMNHWRIISHNPPFYTSREHFGMYTGKDDDDKITKTTAKDTYISYRRFVAQTKDIDNWVSTCEGSWNPWVGPNNDMDKVKKGSDILFTKIINAGNNRITIEAGEEGDDFFTLRIDKLILNERQIPVVGGATPSISGNRFKFQVSDDGSFRIFSGGKGVPLVNFDGFMLEVSKEGALTVKSAKKIIFTHGDVDESINSLILDPIKGVDIKAMNGFRVNGKQLINESFLTFLLAHAADWCLATGIGAPAPLGPAVITELTVKSKLPMLTGGLTTFQVGPPATGIIIDAEGYHKTVA